MLMKRFVDAVRVLPLSVPMVLFAGVSWAQTATESFGYAAGSTPGNGGSTAP